MTSISPRRRRQASAGGKQSKPRKCAACGKHSLSAAEVSPEMVVRRCRSCGHEQGIVDGKGFGYEVHK